MKQRSDGCLLRKFTLFLLWIVAIGSGLYMWGVNFNHKHPLLYDNNTCNNVENYAIDNSTEKINRTKRATTGDTTVVPNPVNTRTSSKPTTSKPTTKKPTTKKPTTTKPTITKPTTTKPTTSKPTTSKPTTTKPTTSKPTTSEATTTSSSPTTEKINSTPITRAPSDDTNTTISSTTLSDSSHENSENTTQQISTNDAITTSTVRSEPDLHNETKNATDQANNTSQSPTTESIKTTTITSGTSPSENQTSSTFSPFENSTDIPDNDEQNVTCIYVNIQAIRETLRPYIHYYSLAWSILALTSSLLGIYGIYKNISKLPAFSIFFFYFTVLTLVLLALEINFDSNIEYRTFVLHEFTGVAWNSCGLRSTKLWMINTGLATLTALSFCFAIIVSKFRRTMIKNTKLRTNYSEDEDSDSDYSIPLKGDTDSAWPNMYASAPPQHYSEEV
ncbi:mucin-2-like [Planococcus citri]|uniref:mucin-2-like n=1 Tax=Planococcus citri TaxID=170843 RepID=UPI0031F8131A